MSTASDRAVDGLLHATGATAPGPGPYPLELSLAPPERRLPVDGLGEAVLVYRCLDCGAVGDLRSFPGACEDCAAPREALAYVVED